MLGRFPCLFFYAFPAYRRRAVLAGQHACDTGEAWPVAVCSKVTNTHFANTLGYAPSFLLEEGISLRRNERSLLSLAGAAVHGALLSSAAFARMLASW